MAVQYYTHLTLYNIILFYLRTSISIHYIQVPTAATIIRISRMVSKSAILFSGISTLVWLFGIIIMIKKLNNNNNTYRMIQFQLMYLLLLWGFQKNQWNFFLQILSTNVWPMVTGQNKTRARGVDIQGYLRIFLQIKYQFPEGLSEEM